MEKIKVNMTPNPLDVQTIHASQNDNEAREWGFELHNNGEKIDSSSISDQLVFKSYKGGTEQILPGNGSTPTTSPFLGDIKYPQGLLTDQEFTYRQSPTEEDGLAKITDIKGNTLNWNQLVPINWVSTRTFSDGLSVTNNNDGSYTLNGTATASRFPTRNTEVYGIQGHKYLIQVLSSQNKAVISQNGSTVYVYSSVIYIAQNNNAFIIYFNANTYNNEKIIPMIIDLTQMFGSGNEPTTVEEFTSLFPLSYYSYNQGSLLSFNGNGIKTVGKNIFDGVLQNGTIDQYGQEQAQANRYRTDFIRVLPSTRYVISVDGVIKNVNIFYYDINKNFISSIGGSLVTTPSNCAYMRFYYDQSIFNANLQLEMLKSGDSPTTYEPYKESTLSLPISTYFPSGMKSAGNVYDELTERKAITRIGSVDLGSLTWQLNGTRMQADIGTTFSNWNYNQVCAKYTSNEAIAVSSPSIDKIMGVYRNRILIYDSSFADPDAFKTAMNGIPLYFELSTYEETSFTTASLVTENAEIPLSNEDGVLIGKCTEQLSENPGFIDAKIKLSDSDGECYSNKLQLHVERSPQ